MVRLTPKDAGLTLLLVRDIGAGDVRRRSRGTLAVPSSRRSSALRTLSVLATLLAAAMGIVIGGRVSYEAGVEIVGSFELTGTGDAFTMTAAITISSVASLVALLAAVHSYLIEEPRPDLVPSVGKRRALIIAFGLLGGFAIGSAAALHGSTSWSA